jgi:hypothetical protein
MPDEDPEFENMSDSELQAFLDNLREENSKRSPRAAKASSAREPKKPKADYIKVDLD